MIPLQWQKLGRVFDPADHKLPGTAKEFAQSPQVVVLHDRVRVFFSTRERDSDQTFVAKVAFADFDRQWTLQGVSKDFVIELGGLGCFDEHGIFPLNVLSDSGLMYGFIGGFSRRASVPIDGAIGVATSADNGLSFKRIGAGPILTASPNEPFLILDPFVLRVGKRFHMWYIYGLRWLEDVSNSEPERVYKIGHAVSDDCVSWHKDTEGQQIIDDVLGEDECQALPTVTVIRDRFHMVFCFREALDFRTIQSRGYRLGHAWSDDLRSWHRADELLGMELSDSGWDSEMLCYPHLFRLENQIHLAYNGNAFGRNGFGIARLID